MTQYKKLKLDNKTCIKLLDIVDEFVEGNHKVANEMLDRLYEEQKDMEEQKDISEEENGNL